MTLSRTFAHPMFCCECLATHPVDEGRATSMCPVHHHEPLLDLREEQVQLFLREDDERRYRRAQARWLVGLGIPAGLLGWGLDMWLALERGGLFYLGILGGVSLGAVMAKKTFRWKYRRFLTDEAPSPASTPRAIRSTPRVGAIDAETPEE